MKNLIVKIASTNSGWITRQILKGVTIGAGALTAHLATKGVDAELNASICTGLVSAASWLAETGLSYIARKYAVS